MRTVETSTIDDSLPMETLQSILHEHSVPLAILFGSYAVGESHSESDLDIAVELPVKHDQPDYNEAFFGLSADLSTALRTDEIDLVDIRTLSPDVTQAVCEQGILLVGEQTRARELCQQLMNSESSTRSPRERFDRALTRINEHLGQTAVTATERSLKD